ncbi:2-isopropylmalate synthase [Candidatus Woesearchaeota archaeon]|nr:2-isopropylmalate synthase [Candidatus Woesearchaeota archaeon]|tara:strand:- start:2155 stop:3723 length:1569 start_codon:yes stop_codon:yes gene_type:complete
MKQNVNDGNRVYVFDTTLRDGEQTGSTRMNADEKIQIARQLEILGVDVIEAGFPISSPEDYKAVELIAAEIKDPIICGLTRAIPEDIEVCGRALSKAKKPRIHTGIGVSDIHITGKFGDEKYGTTLDEKKETIIEMAVSAVGLAREYTDDVEFYAEDAGRADISYLLTVIEHAIDAGATTVNIPDTTGYSIPKQFGALIMTVRESVPNIGRAIISVHCHNDLGMAVANTLSGIENGAQQADGTINGIGERAGNAPIEEIVMALKTRKDYFNKETGINTKEIYRTCRLVSGITVPISPYKAVSGDNAHKHSSGIHVDGFLKKRETYQIMDKSDVGFPEDRESITLTSRTGRHGLGHRLEELGYEVSREELEEVYQRFLGIADSKKIVTDGDLEAIMEDRIAEQVPEVYKLDYVHASGGSEHIIPTATVRLIKDGEKEPQESADCGDGPIDAVYNTIDGITGIKIELVGYNISAVTKGKDAVGEVIVRIRNNGNVARGRGSSTDIIEASAFAYVNALNRLLYSI